MFGSVQQRVVESVWKMKCVWKSAIIDNSSAENKAEKKSTKREKEKIVQHTAEQTGKNIHTVAWNYVANGKEFDVHIQKYSLVFFFFYIAHLCE
jgi:hypothetical protein